MVFDPVTLRGLRICVVSLGAPLLADVLSGFRAAGALVSVVTDAETGAASFASREGVRAAVDRAAALGGGPDLVVISIAPLETMHMAPLTEVSQAEWLAGVHLGLQQTLWTLQAWEMHLKPRCGAIAFVAPSLSLVGCPELIALTTLLEGQRGLMKSVARQWGASGVSLNWIAAAPRALSPLFDEARLAAKPDAVSVALGRPADPARQITAVLGFLGSPAGRAITGATIPLDGGEWMVP